jgi:hypothetical protein
MTTNNLPKKTKRARSTVFNAALFGESSLYARQKIHTRLSNGTTSIRFVVKAWWKTADDMSYSMGRHTMPLKTPASDGRPGICESGGGEVTETQRRCLVRGSLGSAAEAL